MTSLKLMKLDNLPEPEPQNFLTKNTIIKGYKKYSIKENPQCLIKFSSLEIELDSENLQFNLAMREKADIFSFDGESSDQILRKLAKTLKATSRTQQVKIDCSE